MSEPKTHGGARPGSGRRKLGHVTVKLSLLPETLAQLDAVAEAQSITRSKAAWRILDGHFEREREMRGARAQLRRTA